MSIMKQRPITMFTKPGQSYAAAASQKPPAKNEASSATEPFTTTLGQMFFKNGNVRSKSNSAVKSQKKRDRKKKQKAEQEKAARSKPENFVDSGRPAKRSTRRLMLRTRRTIVQRALVKRYHAYHIA